MAITLQDAMEHLNADDDEKEKVELALKHAQSLTNLEIYGNDGDFKNNDEKFKEQRQDMVDRVTLQALTNFYLHASGDTKQNSTNASSQDALINYTRVPSI